MAKFTHIEVEYMTGSRYHITWRDGKARYHIWSANNPPEIYKNPLPITNPDGTERRRKPSDGGYFATRMLNPDAAVNRFMIEWVMQVVNEGDMITAAKEAYLASEKIKADEVAKRDALTKDEVAKRDALIKEGLRVIGEMKKYAEADVPIWLNRNAVLAVLSLIPERI